MTHEPGQKLFVKSPGRSFQLTRRQVLLIGSLLEVKNKKEGVRVKFREEVRVVVHLRWLGWKFGGSAMRVLRLIFHEHA